MKNINLIFGIIISILIAISIYLYIKNLNSQSRISQLEKIVKFQPSMEMDSLVRILEVKNIQESQYLTNLNILSDWIIFYVTVLFGLVVAIQILNFEMRTKNVEQKYEEQKIANVEHFEKFEERFEERFEDFYARFEDLESDVNAVMGQLYSMQGNFYSTKDSLAAFDTYIGAAESYLKSLIEKSDLDKNYYNMKNNLEFALAHLNKYDAEPKTEIDKMYFSGEHKKGFNNTFQFLLSNLFSQNDKRIVIEIMKTFDSLCDDYDSTT